MEMKLGLPRTTPGRISLRALTVLAEPRLARTRISLESGSWKPFLFLFWLGLVLPCLAAPTFTATFDRRTIGVGESATLQLTFSGGVPRNVPTIQPISGLTVGYSGQSEQINIINGRTSRTLTFSFVVAASQSGDFTLPPIRAEVAGQIVTAQPPPLKVLPRGAPTPQENQMREMAFLKLLQPKKEVYVGELFPVEIQLFVQNAQDVQMPQLRSEGFTFGKAAQPAQSRVQMNNTIYNLVVFRMSALAAKTGNLVLGPAECDLTLRLPSSRRDPFDFFGGRYELRRTTLTSELHPVQILPLPQDNVPEDFTGAVGNFTSLTVNASPTNVAVGDPITIRIQITGQGGLDSLALPALARWREFKVYPSTAKVDTTDPLGMTGSKTFEQVVTPENAEVKQLPAISFSFFDPDQKAYRTLQQGPIPISVRASLSMPAQPTILINTNQNQDKPPVRDIVHIKPHLGLVQVLQPPRVLRPGFWLLQAIPLGVWLGALLWRKQRERLANNPRLRRRRQVERLVAAGLRELRQQAAGNQSEEFFGTVFRLLQEQLGERLDLPSSAITEAVIDERLRPKGVDDALLEALRELFQTCNQARYAPERDAQELGMIADKVERTLQTLQHTDV